MEKPNTSAKGDLTKVNVEGCRSCGRVWLSSHNAMRINVVSGWHELSDIQQVSPGDQGLDIVVRVRGRVWGKTLGQRLCPRCKSEA